MDWNFHGTKLNVDYRQPMITGKPFSLLPMGSSSTNDNTGKPFSLLPMGSSSTNDNTGKLFNLLSMGSFRNFSLSRYLRSIINEGEGGIT